VNLREAARGRPCQVRIHGVCNCNPATTVLAHVRMIGISGMGIKVPDALASFACSACHDAIDRRAHTDLDREFVQLAHLQGVMRTQAILIREGALKW